MHTLICGMTESGKSTLAKELGSELRLARHEVLALNPTGEAGYARMDRWGRCAAEWESESPTAFAREVHRRLSKNRRAPLYLIVDEGHEFFTRAESEHNWIGTRGRHLGLNIICITQGPSQMNPTVRGQCGRLYLFACSLTEGSFLADNYGDRDLEAASKLPAGAYYRKIRGKPGLDKGRVF
jgi:hypothetical protein